MKNVCTIVMRGIDFPIQASPFISYLHISLTFILLIFISIMKPNILHWTHQGESRYHTHTFMLTPGVVCTSLESCNLASTVQCSFHILSLSTSSLLIIPQATILDLSYHDVHSLHVIEFWKEKGDSN